MPIMRKHSKQYIGNILKQIIFDDLGTAWMDELELGDVETISLIENILLASGFT